MTTPKKKRPKQSYLTRKADEAFSKFIRQRDGFCQSGRSLSVGCKGQYALQCAHGFGRAAFSTRWDERNAWALCQACHVFYTHRPTEWTIWMEERLGLDLYLELRELSLKPWKGDKVAIATHYKEQLAA